MKKIKIIAAMAALTISSYNISTAQDTYNGAKTNDITVMSYNIRHGVGLDDVTDYKRIAKVITDNGADIVAVQEVDSATVRSEGKYVLGEIATIVGMYPSFARAIPYEGGAYGIGILSKQQPLSTRRIPLPGREEKRTLLIVEFENMYFGCMHLSLTPEDQMASLPIIMKEAANLKKPFIIAGDWNATPSDEFIKQISKYATIIDDFDVTTFPADKPDTLLDYIAIWRQPEAKGQVDSNNFHVVTDTIASDHRPVVARISIKR